MSHASAFEEERKQRVDEYSRLKSAREKAEKELGIKMYPYRLAIWRVQSHKVDEELVKKEAAAELGEKITIFQYCIDERPLYEANFNGDHTAYTPLTLVTLWYYEQK